MGYDVGDVKSRVVHALMRYDATMEGTTACGNHGCIVKSPIGMGTNGPCRCSQDRLTSQRVMCAARQLREELEWVMPPNFEEQQ